MRILYLTFTVALADQITKLMVKGIAIPALGINMQGLMLGSSRPIFGDFLRLTFIENPGMAFGIDIGGKLFFSIFSVIASAAIALYLYRARNEGIGFRVALALILGGAVGNLVDRVFYGVLFDEGPLFYGKVVDFLDCDFFNVNLFGYHMTRWPVFNIADASVTCGVVLLLLTHRSASTSDELIAGQMNVQTAGEGVNPDVVASSVISLNESIHQPESSQSSGTPPQL